MLNSTNSEYSLENILIFLYKWRKPVIIVTIIAFAVSIVVSYMITPMYKSTAIIFPTQANSVSRLLMEENIDIKENLISFGEDVQVEQTLQILKSSEIQDLIGEKYNLMHHYGFSANDPLGKTYLKAELESSIKIRATEYLSIKIDVLDKSPDTAAMIANDIVAYLDTVKSRMNKNRAAAAFKIIEKELLIVQNEVSQLEDSMHTLRKGGIYDYDLQVKAYSDGYARAIAKGNSAGAQQLDNKLTSFEKYGGEYISLRERLFMSRERMKVLKIRDEQTRADMETFLTYKFVVDKAYPAQKKSTPVRWLIVLVSTFSAFALTLTYIIAVERFSKITFQ